MVVRTCDGARGVVVGSLRIRRSCRYRCQCSLVERCLWQFGAFLGCMHSRVRLGEARSSVGSDLLGIRAARSTHGICSVAMCPQSLCGAQRVVGAAENGDATQEGCSCSTSNLHLLTDFSLRLGRNYSARRPYRFRYSRSRMSAARCASLRKLPLVPVPGKYPVSPKWQAYRPKPDSAPQMPSKSLNGT